MVGRWKTSLFEFLRELVPLVFYLADESASLVATWTCRCLVFVGALVAVIGQVWEACRSLVDPTGEEAAFGSGRRSLLRFSPYSRGHEDEPHEQNLISLSETEIDTNSSQRSLIWWPPSQRQNIAATMPQQAAPHPREARRTPRPHIRTRYLANTTGRSAPSRGYHHHHHHHHNRNHLLHHHHHPTACPGGQPRRERWLLGFALGVWASNLTWEWSQEALCELQRGVSERVREWFPGRKAFAACIGVQH